MAGIGEEPVQREDGMATFRTKVAFVFTALLLCGLIGYGGTGRMLASLVVMALRATTTVNANAKVDIPNATAGLPATDKVVPSASSASRTSNATILVTVTGSPSLSRVKLPVTITSTVTGQNGTLSGTVAFWETSQATCGSINSQNSIFIGQGTLSKQGATSIKYAWTSGGEKSVLACYSGDRQNPTKGAAYRQNVQGSPAGLTVSAATGPYGGKTITNLTATLSGSGSVAHKTIHFFLNGVAAGSAQTNDKGVATLDASSVAGINAGAFGSSAAQNNCNGVQGVCASFAGDAAFSAVARSNALRVLKAPLTVIAENKSKVYDGAVFSRFTYTITGFVGGETDADLRISRALSGDPGIAGDAERTVDVGTFTITPTPGNLAATNYEFVSFVNGTLTISLR